MEADDIGEIKKWIWLFPEKKNDVIELNGTVDDYVIVDSVNDFPEKEITVEFWMKSSDKSNSGSPISYSDKGGNDLVIFDYNDFRPHVAGEKVKTEISVTDGYWHHIAVTWRSDSYVDNDDNEHPAGEIKLYRDGAEVYSDATHIR